MPLYAFSLFLPSIINQVRPVSRLPSPISQRLLTPSTHLRLQSNNDARSPIAPPSSVCPCFPMPCHPCVIDLTACRLQGDACEPPHGPRVRLCVSHHMPGRVRRRPARAAWPNQHVSTTRGGVVVRAAAATIVVVVVVVVVGPLTRHLDDSGLLCLGGAGYIILIASRNAALSYVAVYLATWYVPPSPRPHVSRPPLTLLSRIVEYTLSSVRTRAHSINDVGS